VYSSSISSSTLFAKYKQIRNRYMQNCGVSAILSTSQPHIEIFAPNLVCMKEMESQMSRTMVNIHFRSNPRSSSQNQGQRNKTARNCPFPQRKTLIGNNLGFIEDGAVKFACSMGFLDMADRMA